MKSKFYVNVQIFYKKFDKFISLYVKMILLQNYYSLLSLFLKKYINYVSVICMVYNYNDWKYIFLKQTNFISYFFITKIFILEYL